MNLVCCISSHRVKTEVEEEEQEPQPEPEPEIQMDPQARMSMVFAKLNKQKTENVASQPQVEPQIEERSRKPEVESLIEEGSRKPQVETKREDGSRKPQVESKREEASQKDDKPPPRTPWYFKVSWVLSNVALDLSAVVFVKFAMLDFRYQPVNFKTINMYVLNMGLALIDILVSARPVRLLHVYQSMVFLSCYLFFYSCVRGN